MARIQTCRNKKLVFVNKQVRQEVLDLYMTSVRTPIVFNSDICIWRFTALLEWERRKSICFAKVRHETAVLYM